MLHQGFQLGVQLAVVVGQRLNQFLKLEMPPFQFPFGLLHSAAQVFVSQFEKLLAVPFQGFGGGQFGGGAELLFGLFQ